ncbi:MAG: hypothetical protein ACPG4Z_08045 [Chitinophagales bacterium]
MALSKVWMKDIRLDNIEKMNEIKQNITIYIVTIIILLLSGIKIYFSAKLNTCNGLLSIFGEITLLFILFLSLILVIGLLFYSIKKQKRYQKSQIGLCLIVLTALIIAVQNKSVWKNIILGKNSITASIYSDQLEIGILELTKDNKYYTIYGHIDWTCSFTGSYERKLDTLILNGKAFENTGGIISNVYLFTDSILIPLNKNEKTGALKIKI